MWPTGSEGSECEVGVVVLGLEFEDPHMGHLWAPPGAFFKMLDLCHKKKFKAFQASNHQINQKFQWINFKHWNF